MKYILLIFALLSMQVNANLLNDMRNFCKEKGRLNRVIQNVYVECQFIDSNLYIVDDKMSKDEINVRVDNSLDATLATGKPTTIIVIINSKQGYMLAEHIARSVNRYGVSVAYVSQSI